MFLPIFFPFCQAQVEELGLSKDWKTKLDLEISPKDSFVLPDSLVSMRYNLKIFQNDGSRLPKSMYKIEKNTIFWNAVLENKPLRLNFRKLAPSLSYQQKDSKLLDPSIDLGLHIIGTPYTYNPFEEQKKYQNQDQINYSGSFVRGISIGNKQDLMLNSSLDLQLSGQAGGVEITGAISDNNIPIQPQGNTQKIQDFDRLYLQFKLRNHYLQAGDWDIEQRSPSYFLKYQRRIQGGILKTNTQLNKNTKLNADLSFAMSKGKFARNSFNAQEGNQGPYRLQGNNGETWLIVLAGTERVYLDGQLLKRGTDLDYIIDYNLGEITFMPKQPMTKDKRIVIEFSYTDLNYQRSIFSTNWGYEYKNTLFHFHLFTEQDAKQQSNQTGIESDSLRAILQQNSNNPDGFYTNSIKPWNTNDYVGQPRYQIRDTIVNGIAYDSVLVYTVDSNLSTLYTAQFAFLGQGKGNYIRRNVTTTNGVIYDWVAPHPQTGLPQGTHEPLIQIIAPEQKQVFNWGLEQKWKGGKIAGEFALSRRNANTFHKLDKKTQQGYAGQVALEQNWLLWKSQDSSQRQLLLKTQAYYEWVHQNFQAIEPFRSREFQRDWALPSDSSQEHWLKASAQLQHSKIGDLGYEFNLLNRQSGYQGIQQKISSQGHFKGLEWQGDFSQLQSQKTAGTSAFSRPKLDLKYKIPLKKLGFKLGAYAEREKLSEKTPNDSLGIQSLFFELLRAYTEINFEPQQLRFYAQVQKRWNYTPLGKEFKLSDWADELKLSGEWQPKKLGKWDWEFNYRNLFVPDSTLSQEQAKKTYLGRLSHDISLWEGLIQTNLLYELGAGQQQKIDYQYVQVDKGLGTHIWIDRNEDGQQQQNEFEQAPFQDQADYIRAIAPSGDFIRTDNIAFAYSLDIQPKRLWNRAKKGTWQDKINRLQARSYARLERKTSADPAVQALNPFQQNIPDTSLVSLQNTWNNQLFWNRSSPVYSIELSHNQNDSKNTLMGGTEQRNIEKYSLKPRYRWLKYWQTQATYIYSKNFYNSDIFFDRNYRILAHEAELLLTWQWKNKARIQAQTAIKKQENKIGDEEQALHWENSLEAQWTIKNKGNLRSKIIWTKINYEGENNSSTAFAMLQGLQPGDNWQWSLQFDYKLSKLLQMSLSYEGRKTGKATVSHLGKMQIRANF